jgi:beta-phosphoglucomutase
MRSARAIICDFDGLLADSEWYHFHTYSEVFKRYGHTIDEQQYYKYWTSLGLGARGEIERFNLDIDPDDIMDAKMPLYTRYCQDGSITFFPEAREMVKLFDAAGKKLAIASGSATPNIHAILKNEGMEKYFPIVRGKNHVKRPKPDPEVFAITVEELGLKPSECIVLEDAEKGVAAARALGIPVIVIKSRQTGAFDFPDADLVLDSLAEMRDLLKEVLPLTT